jgi:hypothetical protein
MIGIGAIAKWAAIAAIVTTIGFGLKMVRDYHLDQINAAVVAAETKLIQEQNVAQQDRERRLREESRVQKAVIEEELRRERAKVSDLQRMLLIDHDLDRLLQRKPDLILTRVNKGTEEYFKNLEEATQ